ncbi:hypothetical protein ACEZCY_23985 [Streptacidiphilus sp. N1-12]|uniref:Uncharacterized protein n=2 Tax=Streptacidiphilus alkalitolerans TaxID=3342712 RepID=A0ABV6WKG8_9ACTN
MPAATMAALRQHMATFTESGRDGRVFLGAKGGTPRQNQFNRVWRRACWDVGIKGLHFHDPRHTGNTMAASERARRE